MKSQFVKICVAVLAVLSISTLLYSNWFTKRKNDHLTTLESQPLSHFSSIVVKGAGTLHLSQGETESVKIKGDQASAKVNNGVLEILSNGSSEALYYVTVKNLNALTVDGTVNVKSNDRFSIEDFTLIASGNARVLLAVKGKSVNVSVKDAADVLLSGIIENQQALVQDQGKFEAAALLSQDATVTVTGKGQVWVNVTGTLNANASGNGTVRYGGDPEVKKI